ncbi:MAG: ADP-heptose synthase [Verrucomicrobia bacterium GWF2_51_19]|nr:MAG: ADP-heptose synthase [Verrucomicrobia bacterium GWF2_51_19]HCJ11851.1 ADP-heptose synthase [Opitutae bacterium]
MELANPKLKTIDDAVQARLLLFKQGKRVVLTNGCFDLLHAGHIYFLQTAAASGDCLFVALNSDKSVAALKGPSRPLQSEQERAYALSALACVHTVFIFNTPRLNVEMELIRPDIYVKAGDYTLETLDLDERSALEACGAQIQFMPFLQGFSTTSLLEKIRQGI